VNYKHPNEGSRDLVKIGFPTPGEGSLEMETMWAEAMQGGECTLQNIPLLVFGISYGDTIGVDIGDDGRLVYREVLERGGHSAYRLFLTSGVGDADFEVQWGRLHAMGCRYEGMSPRLIAVDIPKDADIYDVYAALEEGQANGVWLFEEGHCGHPLRDEYNAAGSS
jgi:flavodoxin